VLISNTGNLAAMAVVTDPIPMGMTLVTQTLTATLDPPPIYSEGTIHWSGVISGGDSVRLGYAFAPTPTIQRGDRITNTVEIAGSVLGRSHDRPRLCGRGISGYHSSSDSKRCLPSCLLIL